MGLSCTDWPTRVGLDLIYSNKNSKLAMDARSRSRKSTRRDYIGEFSRQDAHVVSKELK